MSSPPNLLGMALPAIERILENAGERAFHARQIYRWIYAGRATSFDAMSDLPVTLRRRLAAEYVIRRPEIARTQESRDGTRKYVLRPPSGGEVEAVYIPEPSRVTLCISPQIGCALDCRFCLTAQLGFLSHLDAGEIIGQVMVLLEDGKEITRGRPVNLVMMGMGEALHNYEQSMAAVRLLADPQGLGIPRRRITLSTAGLAPAIVRLATEPLRPRLAVSLNATTDEIRSRLMPINRKYPLEALLEACRSYPLAPRERLTFEYVMLRGINDDARDPRRLAALLARHKLHAKVNLIPFNEGGGLPYREPSASSVLKFRDDLLSLGVPASVRRNRGRDIAAACGQLALAGGPA